MEVCVLVAEFAKFFDLLKSLVLINLLCYTKPTACIIIFSSLSFQLLYSENNYLYIITLVSLQRLPVTIATPILTNDYNYTYRIIIYSY